MMAGNLMDTLSQTIEILRERGYTENFQMEKEGFTAKISGMILLPKNVKIRKVYRFEGNSDPDDMSILYAIETTGGIKGILVDTYGTYAGNEPDELSEYLKIVKTEDIPL